MAEKEIKSLFLAYYNELRHYLTKKFQDKDLADDLTQETFLHYSEYNRTHPSAVILHKRSYLYRTAHNLAVDYIRRQQREQLDFIADVENPAGFQCRADRTTDLPGSGRTAGDFRKLRSKTPGRGIEGGHSGHARKVSGWKTSVKITGYSPKFRPIK
jgi:RNA polymerase sigma factor (sigma-70 family)